ncbi:MAG: SDR family oxidoreductase [Acetobacteraceae bacterium]
MSLDQARIVVTGGAGLLGQNLIQRLRARGVGTLISIDKHHANNQVLRQQHPDVTVIEADIASPGEWESALEHCSILVIGHAQIGGLNPAEFVRNNVEATRRLLDAAQRRNIPYLVHISSSVVNSMAHDNYTETKKAQEALFAAVTIPHVILRPTLMFGWFDRKHLGWLARFMEKSPVFPIPGSGRYLRQPLYIGDFCNIIMSAMERRMTGTYDISGQERIEYIDLIRVVREASQSKSRIQKIPYQLFWLMLATYARLDSNPPFTTSQLKALITPDVFDVIDWPGIFGVASTPLRTAMEETFRHPVYSKIALAF